MKKTQIYLVILAVLLALALLLFLNNRKPSIAQQKAFTVENVDALSQIELQNRLGYTVKLHKENNEWLLENNEKVKPDILKQLLDALANMYAEVPVPEVAIDNVLKDMVGNSVKVSLHKDGESKAYKVFHVGGPNLEQDGTFMLMEIDGKAAEKPYVVKLPGFRGYLTYRFAANIEDWRSTFLFSYMAAEVKSVRIQYLQEDAPESFYLEKENDLFTLNAYNKTFTNNEVYNSLSEGLFASFLNVNFEKYQDKVAEKDSVMQHMAFLEFEVTTFSGASNKLSIYYMPLGGLADIRLDENGNPIYYDGDRLYALNHQTGAFVSIQYAVFSKFFLKAKQLIKPAV